MSVNIRPIELKDCPVVAQMHNQYIPAGTLNILGDQFVELIFRTLVDSPFGFCLIAKEGQKIIGFVAGTANMKGFYRTFFSRYPFKAPFLIFKKLINVAVLMKVLRLAIYPWKFPDLPDAEGLSFVVLPQYRKTGLTFLLLQKKVDAFRAKGADRVRMGIHSSLLDSQRFFEKVGVKFRGEVFLSKEESMKIYIWDLNTFKLRINIP